MAHENYSKAIDEILKAGKFWQPMVESDNMAAVRHSHDKEIMFRAQLSLARHDGCQKMMEDAIAVVRKYFG